MVLKCRMEMKKAPKNPKKPFKSFWVMKKADEAKVNKLINQGHIVVHSRKVEGHMKDPYMEVTLS